MPETDSTTEEQAEGLEALDASIKIDTSSLGDDERSFAEAMGFGIDDDPPPAPEAKAPAPPAEEPPEPEPEPEEPVAEAAEEVVAEPAAEASAEPEPEPIAAAEPDAPAAEDEAAATSPEAEEAAVRDEADWEDIYPRAASDSLQPELEAQADALRRAADDARPEATGDAEPEQLDALREELVAARSEAQHAEKALEARDQALSDALASPAAGAPSVPAFDEEMQKELDLLRAEFDEVSIERDRIYDQLASVRTDYANTTGRIEQLETSLRAARSASTELPEGERALRAEVLALRGRLGETESDRIRAVTEVASVSTDLAIALARVDDREHELDVMRDQISDLSSALEVQEQERDLAHARSHDLTELAERLQAENTELRSAQSALEETLAARDLEIRAREDHLRVTRRGLETRDEQLQEAHARLAAEQRDLERFEALTREHERERTQLERELQRSQARIAGLTRTLEQIGAAIGHPALPKGDPTQALPLAAATPFEAAPSHEATSLMDEAGVPNEERSVQAAVDASSAEAEDELTRILVAPKVVPEVLPYWRDRVAQTLSPSDEADTLVPLLARRIATTRATPSEPLRILSFAGGFPTTEVDWYQALATEGVETVDLQVVDVEPTGRQARLDAIREAGLEDGIQVHASLPNALVAGHAPELILMSDFLADQSAAESILSYAADVLGETGILVFVGRLAGGEIQLSDATSQRLSELWQVLPEDVTQRAALSNPPISPDNGGQAALGTDLSNTLLSRFTPRLLSGFGHLADLLVGPARGFDLDLADGAVQQVLEAVRGMDESRMLSESLPARHGFGLFVPRKTSALELEDLGGVETLGHPWPDATDPDA